MSLEENPDGSRGRLTSVVSSMVSVLKNRDMQALMMALLFAGGTGFAYTTWIPKFLIDTRGMSLIEGGLVVSAISLSSIPGNVLSGLLTDRLGSKKLVGTIGLVVHFFGMVILIFLSGNFTLPLLILTALMVGISFSLFWVSVYTMGTEIYPARMAGLAAGTLNTFTFVSSIAYPIITGRMIDLTGSYALAFAVPVIGEVVGVILFNTFARGVGHRQ